MMKCKGKYVLGACMIYWWPLKVVAAAFLLYVPQLDAWYFSLSDLDILASQIASDEL